MPDSIAPELLIIQLLEGNSPLGDEGKHLVLEVLKRWELLNDAKFIRILDSQQTVQERAAILLGHLQSPLFGEAYKKAFREAIEGPSKPLRKIIEAALETSERETKEYLVQIYGILDSQGLKNFEAGQKIAAETLHLPVPEEGAAFGYDQFDKLMKEKLDELRSEIATLSLLSESSLAEAVTKDVASVSPESGLLETAGEALARARKEFDLMVEHWRTHHEGGLIDYERRHAAKVESARSIDDYVLHGMIEAQYTIQGSQLDEILKEHISRYFDPRNRLQDAAHIAPPFVQRAIRNTRLYRSEGERLLEAIKRDQDMNRGYYDAYGWDKHIKESITRIALARVLHDTDCRTPEGSLTRLVSDKGLSGAEQFREYIIQLPNGYAYRSDRDIENTKLILSGTLEDAIVAAKSHILHVLKDEGLPVFFNEKYYILQDDLLTEVSKEQVREVALRKGLDRIEEQFRPPELRADYRGL